MDIDFEVLRTPAIILMAITCGLIVFYIGFPEAALIIYCGIVISCIYYSAIHLPRKNTAMVGGLPQVSHGYEIGFLVMLLGNLCLCASFFQQLNELVYIASVMILVGTGLMVGSTSVLFRYIIRRGLKSNT